MAVKKTATRSREFSDSVIDTIREPLIALDKDLRVVSASRSFYEFFKVKPEETVGQLIYNLGNDQWDIPKLRELLETILPQKTTFDDYEVEHDFATIGNRVMLLNARQIERAFGKERIILLAIEDITERKKLESLLIDYEEQYRRLFETASDGIVLLDKREGKITQANPSTEKLLGYTEKESIGNNLQDIGVVLDRGDFQTTIQNLDKSGIINYRNVKVETKSGQNIDTEIYLVDRAKLVQCNIRDVTEHKKVEKALWESEEKYRLLADNVSDVIFVLDMNLNYTYVSPSTKILRGYEPEEVMKVLPADTLTPSSWDLVVKTLSEVMELEKIKQVGLNESRTIPLEMKRKDGTTVWTEVKFSFIRDKDQQPVGILGVTRDITERKRVQEALKESEKKYRLLADNVDDVLFILDTNLNYTYISPSVKTLMGYEPEELLNLRSSETMTPSSWEMAVRTLSEIMEIEKSGHRENKKPQMFQLEMKRKDGSTVWTEIKTSFVRDKNQQPVGIIGVSRDITERKRAEAKLLETLNSLKKAVDTTIHVMVSVIEARDPYTAGHQFRVADLARAIATEMGLDQEKIDGIQLAGSIHDIGKLSVPAEILSKPTKLTKIEFSMIKEHPQSGYEILKDVESPWPLAQVAYQHHERMDGSGYPRNLKGDEILMEARIMAVADVVEAMSSHRPYRSALGIDAALEEIEKNRGTLYDDAVADACLRLFREKNYKLIT